MNPTGDRPHPVRNRMIAARFFSDPARIFRLGVSAALVSQASRELTGVEGHHEQVNTLLIIVILLLLLGGGGFYFGGPAIGGGGIGLILLIALIVYLMGGFRGRR